jgi:site-specific DNA-methyltransferase (adenine-specific)
MDNKLYYGDNLEVLRKYIQDETIDLCYIDPPFNSKRNYNQIYNSIGKEDRAQVQAFTDTWVWNATAEQNLEELTANGKGLYTLQTVNLIVGLQKILGRGSLLAYLVSMTIRIAEIYRVLKPSGSFYLHCDPTASHYLKLILDSVFCPRNGEFRNEIVWCYRGGGYPKKDFGRRHDLIYRYSKTSDCTFNLNNVREEYAQTTKERFAHYIGNKRGGKDFGIQTLNPLGKQPDDWWEIQPLAPVAKERLGYPTQKPEELLEKIIKASSNEGDTVLDAYCGCGTTVAVAHRLERKWVGIDITYQSITLILKRMEESYGKRVFDNIELNGIPQDRESAEALAHKIDDHTRKEFEKWAILTYSANCAFINEKKGKDRGIDGIAHMGISDNEWKDILFSVKSGKVNTSHIRDLWGTIEREDAAAGIFITLQPPTKDMKQEAASAGAYTNNLFGQSIERIKIVTIDELLAGERLPYLHMIGNILKKAKRKVPNNDTKLKFEHE